MQVVNMSAYIQSQISAVSAQSGFYEGHIVSFSLGLSDVYGGNYDKNSSVNKCYRMVWNRRH